MLLKGSQTEKNLMTAFANESEARNKYSFYSSQAKKDGYEQIAAIFDETSQNEKEHAKMWFKELHGGSVPNTVNNLIDAANGEHHEWTEMYKGYSEIAKEEGFEKLAKLFEEVAGIERHHEERFLKLLGNIENNLVFSRGEEVIWVCKNCGYVYSGKDALELCPVCDHEQAFMELEAQNY